MAQKSRADLTTQAGTIKNETTANANTASRVGTMHEDAIDSNFNITTDTLDAITDGSSFLKMTVAERAKIAFNALSTFDGSLLELSTSGAYTNFTMSANLNITFAESAHVEGSGKIVKITADGTDTLTFTKPSAYNLYYPSTLTSGAVLASGIHVFSFWFIGGEIEVHQTTLTKSSGDVTAPTMTSRTIENAAPTQIVMVFDEVVTGTNLGFTIAGTTSTSFASISGSGTNTITGTMAVAAVFGETITLDYSSVTGDIVDGNSNALVTFSGAAVTNNVADATAPTMTSATIENATDSVLDFIFSDAVTITTAGWNIDTDGSALTISSVLSGSGTTTPKFQLSRSVLSTETLNVDYNSTTGNTVKVSNSVELVTFTDTAVTNNVAGAWTPTDLGAKLINWYDGTIVDHTAGVVNNWIDQKGSIDFADNGNDATYDQVDTLSFDTASSEALESDANVASFNRANGEYWLVVPYVTGDDFRIFSLSDEGSTQHYFAVRISAAGGLSIITASGPASAKDWIGTDTYTTGKIIIRIKQTGSALSVIVNEVDITSQDVGANVITTQWESYPSGMDNVRIGNFQRSDGTFYSDLQLNALLRLDATMTAQEASDLYDYLNAKY